MSGDLDGRRSRGVRYRTSGASDNFLELILRRVQVVGRGDEVRDEIRHVREVECPQRFPSLVECVAGRICGRDDALMNSCESIRDAVLVPKADNLLGQRLDAIPADRQVKNVATPSFDHHHDIVYFDDQSVKARGNELIIRVFLFCQAHGRFYRADAEVVCSGDDDANRAKEHQDGNDDERGRMSVGT